jgi:putative membrane protein
MCHLRDEEHIMSIIQLATASPPEHWDGPGAWWPVFPILWFLIIAGAVTFFVVSSRRRARFAGQRAGERRLAERYADGEIDEGEYRARREVLRSDPKES